MPADVCRHRRATADHRPVLSRMGISHGRPSATSTAGISPEPAAGTLTIMADLVPYPSACTHAADSDAGQTRPVASVRGCGTAGWWLPRTVSSAVMVAAALSVGAARQRGGHERADELCLRRLRSQRGILQHMQSGAELLDVRLGRRRRCRSRTARLGPRRASSTGCRRLGRAPRGRRPRPRRRFGAPRTPAAALRASASSGRGRQPTAGWSAPQPSHAR